MCFFLEDGCRSPEEAPVAEGEGGKTQKRVQKRRGESHEDEKSSGKSVRLGVVSRGAVDRELAKAAKRQGRRGKRTRMRSS